MCACLFCVCAPQRGKKRYWKEAYHVASDEVTALHAKLLAKHKDLEGLEAHLNQLHTELLMLGINTGLAAPQQEQRPGSRAKSKGPVAAYMQNACAILKVLL